MKEHLFNMTGVILSFLVMSCNPPSTPFSTKSTTKNAQLGSQSGGQGGLSTSLNSTNSQTNNFTIPTFTSSDINQVSTQVTAAVQNSQQFLNNLNTPKPNVKKTRRIDQFYKCGSNLSHAYVIEDLSPGVDNSPLTLATRFKNSLGIISKDMRVDKIGAYAAYTAAVDSSGVYYVFFSTNNTHDVFYSWQDPKAMRWYTPRSLTGIANFKGLATASFDSTLNGILVQVYNFGNKNLYPYMQKGTLPTFQVGKNVTASSVAAFDQLQAANGTALELNYNITLNDIPSAEAAASSFASRIIQDVMTIGTAEIANALYHDQVTEVAALYNGIEAKVCSP